MSPALVAAVAAGGAVGAPTRYLLDRWIRSRTTTRWPAGTFTVNVIGCFILGLVAAGTAKHGWSTTTSALVGTGFCGGLTTFSTFSVEAVELRQAKASVRAISYVAFSVAVGVGAAATGYALV